MHEIAGINLVGHQFNEINALLLHELIIEGTTTVFRMGKRSRDFDTYTYLHIYELLVWQPRTSDTSGDASCRKNIWLILYQSSINYFTPLTLLV